MTAIIETRRVMLKPGVTTRVLDTGGRLPPVVLVHGLSASVETWRDVLMPLSSRYRVLAFDLPGFGEADKPDVDYGAIPFFIPMLEAFMHAMALQKAHMIGNSMGASLVLRVAYRYPARADYLVLAAPGGFGTYIHHSCASPRSPL